MNERREEISLRDIFEKFIKLFKYLLSKWIYIAVFCLIGGGLGVLYAIYSKPTYTASLTFVLSSDSRSGGLAGLAGQFGIDLGGGNGGGAFEGENIIELLKSQLIIKRTLFTKEDGDSLFLINALAREAKLDVLCEKNERLKNCYPFPANPERLTPLQDSLFRVLYNQIINNSLIIEKKDKKLSFYNVTATFQNEALALYFTKQLVKEGANFYIETKTQTAKQNLLLVKHEADSIRYLLGGTITSTANEADKVFNLNPALQVKRVPIQQGQINTTALSTAYGEIIKNLEIAKLPLQKETPLYQIIDSPSLPLIEKKAGRLKSPVIGAFILGFLCCAFLIAKLFGKIVLGKNDAFLRKQI